MKRFLAAALVIVLFTGQAFAPKGGGGGGFSGGSSSRPSGGFSGGSSRPSSGFSGGSRPSSSGLSSSKPSNSFSGGSKSTGRPSSSGFSGGSTKPAGQSAARPAQVSRKPAASDFNKLANADSKKAESRANYEQSHEPAAKYTTAGGKEVKLDPKDKELGYLRGRLDQAKWERRANREAGMYATYAGRPMVHYADPYHPFFNYWLMSQSLDILTLWTYHHMATMDSARLQWLYANNAGLQARVTALEMQRLPRDPTYTPTGLDPDLAYSDEYANAAFNPTPRMIEETHEYVWSWHKFWCVIRWLFIYIPLCIFGVCVVYWLVFVKRWGGN